MVCQVEGQMVTCSAQAWWGEAACRWGSGRRLKGGGSGSSCRGNG